ncbi:hypothetical protein N0V88_002384 [Collariella sp. IMI 366227]|nr:hypothetical protein N0V88_002384 [Collariella sp. IMI 366227]
MLRPLLGLVRTAFTTSTKVALKRTELPPRPKHPPESDIEESFLKGSGPGGQKINKTSSAVQLKHIPTGVVVKSQATRSRTQNRKIARDLLALKLDEMANGAQSRKAIVGDVKKKRADSKAKKSRRKYRKLAEEGGASGEEGKVGEEGEEWEEVEEGEGIKMEGGKIRKEGVKEENGEEGTKEEVQQDKDRTQAADINTENKL